MDLEIAERLAEVLIDRELRSRGGNAVLWRFRWDDAPKRAGRCTYGTKTITLSTYHVRLNNPPEVRETILHEIAHALVWELTGENHGHDQLWWEVSRRLGCTQGARHHAQTAGTYMKFTFGGD